jgi:outer membrane receptor protein involved in Fe transport
MNTNFKITNMSILFSILLMLCSVPTYAQDEEEDSTKKDLQELYAMSLSELLQVKVTSSSLTDVKNDLSPVPVINISQTDIELSGARSLDELLEIYVPGFIMMYKGYSAQSLGVRGVISDRNNKVLLLVNGKTMNGRTLAGAVSERLLTMLNDIDRIEVIQSPQSSLYGPGAISSVINIYTKDAKTEGPQNEVQVNQGLVDYFTNVQLRHSRKINENLSYSAYYGGDYATGASQENSPTKFTFDGMDGNGDTIISDQPTTYPINNLNASYHNKPRHKAHAQIDYKDWSTWVRYTHGGIDFAPDQIAVTTREGVDTDTSSYKYSHLTAFTNYKNSWEKWGVDARLSYDEFSARTQDRPESELREDYRIAKSYKENELYSRLIFKYTAEKLSIGLGPAISYETFGLPAFGDSKNEWLLNPRMTGYSYDSNQSDSANAYSESWSTAMVSGIGEVQYALRENLNLLGGVRVDKHTYTDVMVSPRASVVWKPKTNHLVRFQYSRSNRRAEDSDLRYSFLAMGNEVAGDVETIDFYELSGDIGVHKKVVIRPSVFYSDYDIVAWNFANLVTENLGNLKYAGGELSAIYKSLKAYGKISHSYTQLIDFNLIGEQERNNVSTEPYGYGNDFYNYPTHLTKLFYQYMINKKMSVNTSLQVTWYLQGAEDAADYTRDSLESHPAMVISDGSTKAFEPSVYLNAGYVYKFTKKMKASLFAYNLLGLIDEDLSKRVNFQRTSQYRIQPTSFALRFDFDF